MSTINGLLKNTLTGEDFYLLLGDYLDAFYRADSAGRQAMIADAPFGQQLECKHEYLCFMAATAHKLANDYQLQVPSWVFDKYLYMTEKPFFAAGAKGKLRLLFMYKSPTEFKHRNMFVDENVLQRV